MKYFRWHISKRGYVVTNSKKLCSKRFHRALMKPEKDSDVVDHINRNKTDNRRCNLRIVSQMENIVNSGIKSTNKSGIKGIAYHKSANKWEAYITVNYKKKYLGIFDSIEDAIEARKNAERIYNRVDNSKAV